jgi:hypothetical protein
MGAKAIGLGPREGIGGNPSPASDTEIVDNKRVRNPADVAAGIGGEQDGTFAGGATPQEIEDADAFSFFDFLKSKKGAFKDFSNDVGDAVLNQKRRYAPSGGMMKGAAQAAAQYGKREMDLVNAYKKAAEAALQDPGAPQFMGRGLMSLANGGPVYMANGTPPTMSDWRINRIMEQFGVTEQEALDMIINNPGIGEENREPGTPFEIPETNTHPLVNTSEISDAERRREAMRRDREGFGLRYGTYYPEQTPGVVPPQADATQTDAAETAPQTPAPAPAAPREPSELDLYKQYMENMLRLNKEFLDERRQKAEDARGGGLGSFLRRLGIGVLSSPSGKFGDMLASGITNVASAQSKAQQEYLDRIGKLDEAELAYQLQAAKMPYELAVLKKKGSGLATPADIQKYLIDQISDLNEKETKLLESGQLASPAELKRIRDQIAEYEAMLQRYGYPARPTPQRTEVSPEDLNELGR